MINVCVDMHINNTATIWQSMKPCWKSCNWVLIKVKIIKKQLLTKIVFSACNYTLILLYYKKQKCFCVLYLNLAYALHSEKINHSIVLNAGLPFFFFFAFFLCCLLHTICFVTHYSLKSSINTSCQILYVMYTLCSSHYRVGKRKLPRFSKLILTKMLIKKTLQNLL